MQTYDGLDSSVGYTLAKKFRIFVGDSCWMRADGLHVLVSHTTASGHMMCTCSYTITSRGCTLWGYLLQDIYNTWLRCSRWVVVLEVWWCSRQKWGAVGRSEVWWAEVRCSRCGWGAVSRSEVWQVYLRCSRCGWGAVGRSCRNYTIA